MGFFSRFRRNKQAPSSARDVAREVMKAQEQKKRDTLRMLDVPPRPRASAYKPPSDPEPRGPYIPLVDPFYQTVYTDTSPSQTDCGSEPSSTSDSSSSYDTGSYDSGSSDSGSCD